MKCPKCEKKLIEHVDMEEQGAFPKENDYSICSGCYAVLQFNKDLSLRIAEHTPLHVAIAREMFMRIDAHSRN